MQQLYKLSIIVLAAAMQACASVSYTAYTFERLRPADYVLPQNCDTIVIMNSLPSATARDLSGNTSAEVKSCMRNLPDIGNVFFAREVNNSKFVHIAIEGKTFEYKILPTKIDSICRARSAQAVISLRDYSVDTQSVYSVDRDDIVRLDNQIIITAQYAFMLPDGRWRDFELRVDTVGWIVRGASEQDAYRRLPPQKNMYYSAAQRAGENFAEQIVPAWETCSRYIYSSRNRLMTDAAEWVRREQWDNARDLWQEVYLTGSALDRARAAVDLALYYERQDNVGTASIWCSKALDLIQSGQCPKLETRVVNTAEALFVELMERQDEIVLLDKQMIIQ